MGKEEAGRKKEEGRRGKEEAGRKEGKTAIPVSVTSVS
jgi:hypothetical protein